MGRPHTTTGSIEPASGFILSAKTFGPIPHNLTRDLTAKERALYNIAGNDPTCAEFITGTAEVEPTWTPVPTGAVLSSP